jgi:hypothetical protein
VHCVGAPAASSPAGRVEPAGQAVQVWLMSTYSSSAQQGERQVPQSTSKAAPPYTLAAEQAIDHSKAAMA